MERGPVWLGGGADTVVGNHGIKKPLKGFIVKGRQGPGKTGGTSPADGFGDGGLRDPAAVCYCLPALATGPGKTQHLSNLSHGNSFLRHSVPLQCEMKGEGYPLSYLATTSLLPVALLRNRGRVPSGMPVAIAPESRSRSRRNRGHFRPEYASFLRTVFGLRLKGQNFFQINFSHGSDEFFHYFRLLVP